MRERSNADQLHNNMERIYHEWDQALSNNDAERLLQLYARDAIIESPLIPHLLGKKEGICRGHEEMRGFFQDVARRKPVLRQYHRTGYLTVATRS